MPVIVFDLDDTLYEELNFVRSGFQAVTRMLHERYGIDLADSLPLMWEELQRNGRGKVFDRLLETYGLLTKANVRRCVSAYRLHAPNIRLDDEAVRCLEALRSYPMYIVTDGNKLVQYNKLIALGLYEHPYIRKCYITRRYGIHNEKPSPYCFREISRLEKAPPQNIVYVGDNPRKDFVGIKLLGFRTVRILKGGHKDVRATDEYEAEHTIQTLDELPGWIERNMV